MKTLVFIFSMMTFLTLNSLGQDKKIAGLPENPEDRAEIFKAIVNDHGLMIEFMQAMKGNEHAMMMKGHNPMMEKDGKMEMSHEQLDSQHEHQMMGHGDMMGMMKENPEMMQETMANMMDMCKKDSSMCSNMADMMTEHPEMMKMCMKKMKEKGMMGPDGKMKMKDTGGKSTGNEHNHQH